MKSVFILAILVLALAGLTAQTMVAPYFENFDTMTAGTGIAPQNGWDRLVYHPTGFANATVNIATATPRSAPNVARMFTDSNPDAQIILISPEAVNLASSRIRFWSRIQGTSATALPDMQIGFMTDPTDHESFMPVSRITNLSLSYQQYEVSFQGHDIFEEDRHYVAFRHGISTANRAILIDDFSYEANPLNPLFAINPVTKNFGTVDVGFESNAQIFTITNAGTGQLGIESISLTGADHDQFIITDQPDEYPVLLSNTQSASVTVIFSPTTAGDKTAYLSVVDNQGARTIHNIPLSGRGFIPPPGANHNNPIPITLPEYTFSDIFDDYGNDYAQNWVTPSQHYLVGNDVVFLLDLQEDSYVSASLVLSISHGAITIVNRAPNPTNPAPVFVTVGGDGGGSFSRFPLQMGSYYVIVSAFWSSPPNSGQTFLFNFLAESAGPPTIQISPETHTFAYVPIGLNISRVFNIKNLGGGAVNINSIQFQSSTSDFSYIAPSATPPFALNIGQSIEFTVNFTPQTAGAKLAQAIIQYTLNDSPEVVQQTVTIDGIGYHEFAGGSGTETDPYLIATPYHLNSIRYHLGEASRGKHYLQTADLDFDIYPYNTGSGWIPIGYYNTDTDYQAFTGNYNGNGLGIANLYSNHPSTNHIGLFGVIEGAGIRNVHLRNVDVTGQVRVGALVG
ncbi:MAG: choice-of-anchor D domain-containing protein, partial [Candidatus Cloacimonadaceae bacterium]|nr:choice-of-anchor D domain-containing protein [Candidatus Cloacimonadaceae bacterium]